jgi:hypothetical protein
MSPADPVRAGFPDAAAAVRPRGLFANACYAIDIYRNPYGLQAGSCATTSSAMASEAVSPGLSMP